MEDLDKPDVIRRVVLSYATDLLVAITVVLICGRLLTTGPNGIVASPILSDDFLAAIGRFTPFGLWQVYQDTLLDALRNFSHEVVTGPLPSLLLGMRTIMLFLMAAPNALLAAYWQSQGTQVSVSVAAAIVTAAAFALMMSGGRPSPVRLLLAAMLAPALTSIIFWLAQHILLDAMTALAWFVHMAPCCLPCPILCTLWWVCFPRASHGATGSLVLFLQRLRGARAQRRAIRSSPAGTRLR